MIAGRAGALRSTSLEPPFVGRDRELRLVKELYHASADERRAQLVSVVGVAGIGKSRLSWEFEKYQDGLADEVWWHRGRCLSYGEGVAYWALAEMVRMRCGIAEDEEPASALRQARRHAWRARHRSGGAQPGRAAARPPPRPRGGRLRRPGEPVLGLARPVRAAGRGRSGRARLRGHAVGRRRPRRLRRLPARLVAEPSDLRPLACPAGARREAPDLGRRQARGHFALPRAAAEPGDGGAAHRARSRPAGGAAQPDPRSRRGRAALCRRDSADAARPRPPRAGRDRFPPDRSDRDVGGARDAARARRRAPRRSERRGAAARAGRLRDRKDVHGAGPRRGDRARRRRARAAARVARSQGGALDPGRPALTGARSVRVPPGHRQARRLRDALEARSEGQAPRGCSVPGHRLGRGGGRDRRGRRCALPRRLPRRAGGGRRTTRSRPRRARCWCARPNGPLRWGRPPRRSARTSVESS